VDVTEGSRTTTGNVATAGLVTLLAGLAFILGPPLSAAIEWAWLLVLVGIALLLYAVPKLHRHQAPADGALGLWGTRLFMAGSGIVVALAIVFLIWEAVGEPTEGGFIDIVWMVGFFGFLIGFVLFVIGSFKARVLDPVGLWLVVIGLVGAVALDMATGAFFQDETGTTTEWGFYLGVPLAGIGLAWIGAKLRSLRSAG
jgi:hypothetical protein